VLETADLKTTSRIWPHKIMKGQNAGLILPGYAKTAAQVCDDAQMLGYARQAVDKYPGVTHHRLSHIYAQTSSKAATKRTGLISVEQVLHRWQRVEVLAGKMVQVATATRIEDIEPTVASCDAYTHVQTDEKGQPVIGANGKTITLKGCGHRYYCPLSDSLMALSLAGAPKEKTMSLMDQLDPAAMAAIGMTPPPAIAPHTPTAPPSLPMDAVTERAAIEAEKARLLAEDGKKAVAPCGSCGVGCQPGYIKTETGYVLCRTCLANGYQIGAASLPATAPPPPQSPMAVLPPDVPPPAPLLAAAAPLPPSALAEITDPALRQTVETHAAQHKAIEEARLAAEAAAKEAAGSAVWCAESKKRLVLDMDMALSRKYTCSCTKVIGLKPAKLEGGGYEATIPRHKPVNKPEAPAASVTMTAGDEDEIDEGLLVPADVPVAPMPMAAAPPPPPAPMTPAPPAPAALAQHATPVPPPPPHLNGGVGNGHHTKTFASEDVVAILKSIDERLHEMCNLLRTQQAS
jgi:hypothetical protein